MTGYTYSTHEDIKKYQRMKRIFKEGKKVISKEQKEKYFNKNWEKLQSLMLQEKNNWRYEQDAKELDNALILLYSQLNT